MKRKIYNLGLLFAILLIGAFFRFFHVNWDSGAHLHPDERFLTMVANAMRVPENISTYINPAVSTFNPVNVGYPFFVYGTAPLSITKFIAVWLNRDTYGDFTIVGRYMSGLMDMMALGFVMATTSLLVKKVSLPKTLPYWSGLAYALMVLPIQLSHFYATDMFLNTFMFAAFYFCFRYFLTGTLTWIIPGAFMFGLALASKLNALYIAPLLGALIILQPVFQKNAITFTAVRLVPLRQWMGGVGKLFLFMMVAYGSLRIGNPYTFESTNWLNPQINRVFLKNIESLQMWSGPDVWFPPAVQWISKRPLTYAAKNIALLGIGLGHSIFLVLGFIVLFTKRWRRFWWLWLLLFGWVGSVFFYQSIQFVKALRYFIFLYPLLALVIGIGISYVLSGLSRYRTVYGVLIIVVIAILAVWPLMFLSIYIKPNTRVSASYWMYDNLPDRSFLVFEHWDDGLPVVPTQSQQKTFDGDQLPVFGPDDDQKWTLIEEMLTKGDYYLLTSNRGWGSIPTVPNKYPKMTIFYEKLLHGDLYPLIADFASYPSLAYLGIPFTMPDDWADETFTVYDHPRVLIYRLK